MFSHGKLFHTAYERGNDNYEKRTKFAVIKNYQIKIRNINEILDFVLGAKCKALLFEREDLSTMMDDLYDHIKSL